MPAREFRSDEDAYLAWVRSHGGEYVLNRKKGKTDTYLVLHRTSRDDINDPSKHPPGQFTCPQYIKACADTEQELRDYIRDKQLGFTFTKRCGCV